MAAGMTRSQQEVLAALGTEATFRSAQEIHARLRGEGSRIGLTSVYRALQALADSGAVDVVRQHNGELAYRRCASTGHHHHLVCIRCGEAVEVTAPALEQWVARVADEHGYSVTSHTLEISGTCRTCAQS